MDQTGLGHNKSFYQSLRRGFTLIELLVVIAIITLLLGILIPAVGAVRSTARSTATSALMKDLSSAIQAFEQQNGRLPGYFLPSELGSVTNETNSGFTSMENVMLDLAGGIAPDQSRAVSVVDGLIRVGPYDSGNSQNVLVDLNLIGSKTNGTAYFTPDPKYYQVLKGQRTDGDASNPGAEALPDLIDDFDTPILMWRKTESLTGSYTLKGGIDDGNVGTLTFARLNHTDGTIDTTERAAFYLGQNNGWLASLEIDASGGSMLGDKSGTPDQRLAALTSLLGNPSFPNPVDLKAVNFPNPSATDPEITDLRPAAARGTWVLHSGGKDGLHMEGNISETGLTNPAYYGHTFLDGPEGRDVMKQFDDQVVSGGN